MANSSKWLLSALKSTRAYPAAKAVNSWLWTKKPRTATIAELIEQGHEIEWTDVCFNCADDLALRPKTLGPELPRFLDGIVTSFPQAGVVRIPNAGLLGPYGFVEVDGGIVLPELCWHRLDFLPHLRVPRHIGRRRRIGGVCLSLANEWADKNYAHLLYDSIGRLCIFEHAGLSLSDVDQIYVPAFHHRVIDRICEGLGLPKEKIVLSSDEVLIPDVLIATTCPGHRRNWPPWVVHYIRSHIATNADPKAARRLYITRSGYSRKIVNELPLRDLLTTYGFEIYDPAQAADQMNDFAEAEIVVGSHGAGLSNIAFCRPGTAIVELIPSDHPHQYFFSLAQAAGLDYYYITGSSTAERNPATLGPSHYNFRVDLDIVEATLAQALTTRADSCV